jgi:hypothetical protein
MTGSESDRDDYIGDEPPYPCPEDEIPYEDTRSPGEIEHDAREAAGDRKYHEMRDGRD